LFTGLLQCEYGNSFPSPAEDETRQTYDIRFHGVASVFYLKTNREMTIIFFTTTTTTKVRSCLNIHNNPKECMISGFRREVDDRCNLVKHYEVSSVQELSHYSASYHERQLEVIFNGVPCSPSLPVVIS
jgi:hypothetical protein